MSELKIDSFDILLRGFDSIIIGYPEVETVRKELEELKSAASLDSELTFWQKDAIVARCNNYLNGKYGEQVKKFDNRSDYMKKLS